MQSDRELLEAAARAIGWRVASYSERRSTGVVDGGMAVVVAEGRTFGWSPLHDDGDAFRLAIKGGISLTPYPIYNETGQHSVIAKQYRRSDMLRENNPTEVVELYGDDPRAATRRAIVRAAASMPPSAEKEEG